MHTFIYPTQDTYINNSSKYKNKNFGLDEILEIYASNDGKKTVYSSPYWYDAPLTASSYGNEGWLAYTTSSIFIYSGSKWRAFGLTSSAVPGTTFIANFTGKLKNKTNGTKIALYLSGSSNYASGSFSGSVLSPQCITSSYSGSFISSSGWSGIISTVTSSNSYYVDVVNFVGYFKGVYTGSFTVPTTSEYLITPEFSRTLLKFDLTELSQSISNNTVSGSDIKFTLNLKCCGARNIPLNYSVYAYPLNQAWDNGNGRYADDGSQLGCSWNYRNYEGSGIWYGNDVTGSIYTNDNYLLTASYATGSWKNQGGTWYYKVPSSYTNKPKWICSSSKYTPLANSSLICNQTFSYGQQSDIKMDITRIIRSWLCGCVPNNGLILLTSFEISTPPLQNTNGLLQF
jgi:hypothetical protein